ncbi:hypothetical protein [Sulfuricurvum sp. RIFCSPLOWO2_12_FULL_43_24]|uniref:hypothetical protein n=1 Tax=Sulfuricurvum sp. RIFCSPLOWO2_12_FULL_43_24 TaxID=1802247 RepID=UPI0008BE2BBB|nr:hypothetical protein [Sulfuricurvum sp. RIFCSPLOWO2_12_FULL_43_24]OHD90881.1 MAG: hypothetical protein A3G19_06210 [Sulfuricurvum sp. RIFCSPLOWO2_12_FULL_43_24]
MALVIKNDQSRHRNQVLAVCLALALFTGISAHAKERTNLSTLKELNVNQTKKDKYAALKEPKTVEDLLKNLKYAFDHDWFLNDDFYAISTLQRVLGKNNDELHTHYFNSHGDETDHLIESGRLQSNGYNFKYRQKSSDKAVKPIIRDIFAGYEKGRNNLFYLHFERGEVFFEEVEAIFGKGWQYGDLDNYGWVPSPKTSEYGNSMIEYHADTKMLNRSIYIPTDGDGSIMYITIQIEEKK